ncbi:MAG TPA: glycoside hydrolase family 30 beta sandwich domain-containing protein [Cyclobacteriaceae bacterium]|nr:glycoside hydrolase family 30 beta sandwich domain-containing protein [Cyclobacteriaceae bacterium]
MIGRKLECVFLVLTAFFSVAGCGDDDPKYEPPHPPNEIGKAQSWLTMGDQSVLLGKQNDLSIIEEQSTTLPVITVDITEVMQEIEGFGAALTGSSAYLINRKMNSSQRNQLLNDLFDSENGIGISYLRMTIGASDFSLSDYTYDDAPPGDTDYSLSQFSIAKDKEDVIPVFKLILAIAPDIKIMGSPWSPPAWMKTNDALRGGKLKLEAYDAYANYFLKYIDAFKEEGITIDAITVQNEPLFFTANYPCMEMTADEERAFITQSLGPLFKGAGVETKIILYDHNWDNTDYAISILNEASSKEFVAGSAFHAYAGNVSAMGVVHAAHPDKGLYFTEVSGGEWATNFSDNLQWNMSNIFIGTTKNWSKNVLLWNLALDQNFGPQNSGCTNCRGVVTINASTGNVTRNVEYYSIGHFSKFIRPGAHRVGSSISSSVPGLDYVAFVNADESRVIVLTNDNDEGKNVVVREGEGQFSYSIPARSVATVRW